MSITTQHISEALVQLKNKLRWDDLPQAPKVGVVLGSGLGAFAESLQDKRVVSFADVPHMPESTVAGHAGEFVCGKTKDGFWVVVQKGRIHYYEGHDLDVVTFPIRLLKGLGLEHVVLTTSTGSVNLDYNPGEFMIFTDHLNFAQVSPLKGVSSDMGERFVDLSSAYDSDVRDHIVAQVAKERSDIVLHQGVFAYVVGPHYETPADIRALRVLGADVVSMSTVPEAIVAKQCGLKLTALANITNYGSGIKKQVIEHSHVAKAASISAPKFIWLLENVTKSICNESK